MGGVDEKYRANLAWGRGPDHAGTASVVVLAGRGADAAHITTRFPRMAVGPMSALFRAGSSALRRRSCSQRTASPWARRKQFFSEGPTGSA